MLKKTLWSVILVLVTTFSVFLTQTGLINTSPTATPTVCLSCTQQPTKTPTPEIVIPMEPTTTPRVTLSVGPTSTFLSTAVPPTATSTKQPTVTVKPPTATVTAQPTATAIQMLFTVQRGSPVFITNFVHKDAGCNWQGYAGQVFDRSGNPLKNYIVKITGTYNNKNISILSVTGLVSGNPYGPGSYEIVLGNSTIGSYHLLSMQLFNSSGVAVTDSLLIDTSAACAKNLGIINFKQK